jgi:hypothetical protein
MSAPDAQTATRDEKFASWLAMNEYLVEDDFLVNDVDAMPDNPFSEEGLRVAEAEALRRFDDAEQALAPENRELYDKFVRFIGEAIIRGIGGEWTNRPLVDDGKAYLGLRFPWRKETLTIPTLFTAALSRRTGEEWAFVYRNLIKKRDSASS